MAELAFQDAVRNVLTNYATFTGRARRAEFWWFALFNVIVRAVLGVIDRAIFGSLMGGGMMGMGGYGMHSPGPLVGIYSLAVLLPSLAVGARRLHDTGKSGWWMLLFVIPVIGWLVLLYFFVTRGDAGANAFGPDPIAA